VEGRPPGRRRLDTVEPEDGQIERRQPPRSSPIFGRES
jgi:hypothetical protein